MKRLAIIATLIASPVYAGEATKIKIYDHTKNVTQSIPMTERRCQDVQVPIYQKSQTSSGDVLLGAILGGVIGKGVTKNDGGAALGAISGIIIADQNGQKSRVSGYRLERQCNDVTVYQNSNEEVYSHSTIRFFVDGKRYVVPFQK
jgi:uncharacterized protein YcfJ